MAKSIGRRWKVGGNDVNLWDQAFAVGGGVGPAASGARLGGCVIYDEYLARRPWYAGAYEEPGGRLRVRGVAPAHAGRYLRLVAEGGVLALLSRLDR